MSGIEQELRENGRRKYGCGSNPEPTGMMKPVIAIIIMVAITVVLAAVLYVWSQSFASGNESVTTGWQEQEVPARPTDMHIEARMDVEYVKIDGELTPTYTLSYYGRYTYETSSQTTTAILPLPETTIENIWVILNGVQIDHFVVSDDAIRVPLPPGLANEVEVSYRLQGSDEFYHEVPQGRVIDSFYMQLTIDGIDERSALDPDSLNPDRTQKGEGKITYTWDKKMSLLRDDISIVLPEENDPYEAYGLFLGLMTGLTILFLIFYHSAITRLGRAVTSEDLVVLITPFILLAVGVGLFLIGGDVGIALALGLGVFIAMEYLFVFRVFKFKANVEMFSIPLLFAGSAAGYSFLDGYVRTLISAVLLVFAILIYVIFMVRYKAILRPNETPVILKKRLLKQKERAEEEKEAFVRRWSASEERWEAVVGKSEQEIGRLKSTITDLNEKNVKKLFAKRHCPFCSDDIDRKFTFCPSCGKDVSIVVKCDQCGALMDSKYAHCPNCGDRNDDHIEEAEEVPPPPPS